MRWVNTSEHPLLGGSSCRLLPLSPIQCFGYKVGRTEEVFTALYCPTKYSASYNQAKAASTPLALALPTARREMVRFPRKRHSRGKMCPEKGNFARHVQSEVFEFRFFSNSATFLSLVAPHEIWYMHESEGMRDANHSLFKSLKIGRISGTTIYASGWRIVLVSTHNVEMRLDNCANYPC